MLSDRHADLCHEVRRKPALTAEPYRDADDVLDVLDFVGVDRVVVVGSSLGGRVALEVAGCFPERVAGLVLLCPAFRFDELSPSAQGFAEREAALLESGDLDGAAELNVRTWLGPDADDATRRFVYRMQRDALALQAEVRSKAGHDIPSVDLASIMVPTAIMSGGKDLDHFQQVAALLAESIRGARLRRLDWAGHLPNLERPAEVTALLLELLERP
jgi:3-oxoadipate enol-lactonase